MSLFAKLGTLGFVGAGIGLPIPFVLRIGCGDPSTSKTWNRWVTRFPYLACSGSKSRIYVSLAFKSDTQRRSPSHWDEEDLYLNGQGYDASGKAINFGETFRLERGLGQQQGNIQHRWQLTVFESGRIRISEASAGHGDSYGEDDIMCDKSHVFEKGGSKGWYGDQWDGDVAKVKLKIENCSRSGSRRECDIEIADSVGLKWGTTVKPKAIFCASH